MMGTIHRAKYALVDPYVLMPNAAVDIVENGTLANITPWRDSFRDSEKTVVDWGSAVILPGLINAHAHLELTSLCNRLTGYNSFTDWLSQLIAKRRSWSQDEFQCSIREGIDLSLASGTTTVGDIATSGMTRNITRGNALRQVIFEESIAFSPGQAEQTIADLNRILDTSKPGELIRQGVSPHSPYSVSGELYRGLSALARHRKMPLTTHIAETESEIQFLKTGTGEFRDFLQTLNVFPTGWNPPGLQPIPYLHSLGVLGPNCLLIHCNYMDRESIDLVAGSGSSIVYCPRSHAFFDHPQHPVRKLLDAGINIALGTDSLASNTTLSMLDEMRFLYKERKDLKSEEILRAATINGAKALNYGNSVGLLKSGCRADMTVLEVPSNMKPHQVPDQILEGAGKCIGTIVEGRIVYKQTVTR
jgi:cytosine/adenosine deaminase-related metal-dependent hydrolase